MRALQLFAVLASVAADAADHDRLRKQPCDKDCQIKRAQSKVDNAEEALDKNMEASHANKKMIAYTKSIRGNSDIASQEKAVAAETQTSALGAMLGSMWREMREYQTPMYEEKLGAQSSKLADEHESLQAKLARARAELDTVTAKEAAQESIDDDDEGPPAKLVIEKPHDKAVKMHSSEDEEEEEDNEKDDEKDDDEEDDDKKVSSEPVKSTKKPCGEEDAEAVAEEAEQEVDEVKAKKDAPAPNHRPWSNNGLAKGMAATVDQHAQLWKHGLSAGDPGRKGMYPVDLTAPTPEKEEAVEAPEEPKPEPEPAPKPAKIATDPEAAEGEEEDEADAVKRVEAASEESKDEDGDAADDEDGEESKDAEKEKAPTKAVAGEGDIGDGMSATHRQFKKFMSGGFFNGDSARQGLYPTDLTK